MKTIIFIRHGETDSVKNNKLCGRTDIPLNFNGINQSNKLLDFLYKIEPDIIYSSPLTRARQTAEIISNHFNKSFIISDDLKEIDFGDWEGCSFSELESSNKTDYKKYLNNPGSFTPKNGESINSLIGRSQKFIDILLKNDQKTTYIVTHGGPIKASLINFMNMPIDKFWNVQIPHGSATKYKYENNSYKLNFLGQVIL
jgi:alpha-ribazole phosphatase